MALTIGTTGVSCQAENIGNFIFFLTFHFSAINNGKARKD
jgi:hypothetical protein